MACPRHTAVRISDLLCPITVYEGHKSLRLSVHVEDFYILYEHPCTLSVVTAMTDSQAAPLFPAVQYELKKFNLTPLPKSGGSPYIGYGPSVDRAWDYIANDSKPLLSHA